MPSYRGNALRFFALANCYKSMDAVHEVMTELDGSNWFVVINEPPHSGLETYLSDPELRHFTNTHSTNVIITNMKCWTEKWLTPLQDCIIVHATLFIHSFHVGPMYFNPSQVSIDEFRPRVINIHDHLNEIKGHSAASGKRAWQSMKILSSKLLVQTDALRIGAG